MQFDQLRRRDFVTLLGGTMATWPLAVRAQQPAMPVIGFLAEGTPDSEPDALPAFRHGLRERPKLFILIAFSGPCPRRR